MGRVLNFYSPTNIDNVHYELFGYSATAASNAMLVAEK